MLGFFFAGVAIGSVVTAIGFVSLSDQKSGKRLDGGGLDLGDSLAEAAGLAAPAVVSATAEGTFLIDRLQRTYPGIAFSVNIRNRTSTAMPSAEVYVRLVSGNRTVPLGKSSQLVNIPGGIEPGEDRTVSFTARLSEFSLNEDRLEFQLPNRARFEVSLSHDFSDAMQCSYSPSNK